MNNQKNLAGSFTTLLVLAAGLAAVALTSVWASRDPWDGRLVDPDYQHATPQTYEDFAAASRIACKFPAERWETALGQKETGVRIKVQENAKDRLLILERRKTEKGRTLR